MFSFLVSNNSAVFHVQKSRSLKQSFNLNNQNNNSIYLYKQVRLEFAYFIFFKKFLKKNIRFKYSKNFNTGVLFFFNFNFPVSKKSKNSRMGKGVGSFIRWSMIIKPIFRLFRFIGLPLCKVNRFRGLLSNFVGIHSY